MFVMDQLYTPLKTLKDICVRRIVDDFDEQIFKFYGWRPNQISDGNLPNFGPVKDLLPSSLMLIIDELIRREKLQCRYLQSLLPREARSLTCDENSEFSPFIPRNIETISRRCPNFEILHFHKHTKGRKDENQIIYENKVLRRSIPRFRNLKKINFYDSKVDSQTIRVITRNCPKLIELNLRKTYISDEGMFYLHDRESVIRYSLTTLIIDETAVSGRSAVQSLFRLRNLTHFQFDRLFESLFDFFENVSRFKSSSTWKFKTTIFKSTLNIFNSQRFVNETFQNWLIERIPEIRHLILMYITRNSISFVDKLIKSLKYLKHLELSAADLMRHEEKNFAQLIPILLKCSKQLITLKLENFCNVNACFLGQMFENLEKLSLIKSCIKPIADNVPFANLKEFEIIYSENCLDDSSPDDCFPFLDLHYDSSLYILFSKSLEKIFMFDEYNFNSALVQDLLNKGFLKNLKELKVFFCPIEMDCIMRLFTKNIPIETIVLGSCDYISDREAHQISKFIKENNYSTNFSLTNKDPHCLRWRVVDSKTKCGPKCSLPSTRNMTHVSVRGTGI